MSLTHRRGSTPPGSPGLPLGSAGQERPSGARGRTLTMPAMLVGSVLLVGTLAATPASATPVTSAHGGATQGPDGLTLERLDRGLVAAVTNEGVFLSWRLLAS